MFSKQTYIERRDRLKKELKSGIILIPGNTESPMSCLENNYTFIQDSTFLYYFGIDSPDLIGVIDIDNDKDYIFGEEFTIDHIVWMGQQKTFKERASEVGIENFLEKIKLTNFIKENNERNFLYTNQYRIQNSILLGDLLSKDYKDINEDFSKELVMAIINMRNIKTDEEIEEIEKAVNATREMHLEAMKAVKAGKMEYEIAAIIDSIAGRYNGTTSFHTICTVNGQILHNHHYDNKLEDGKMMLIDCGTRLKSGYCGDMTTSFPVNGKFDDIQKKMYGILIDMFETAEKIIKPGITYKDVHLEVSRTLINKMKELNIFKGETEDILESGAHAVLFPHGLGHMLGMDVHDMENFGETNVGYKKAEDRSTQFGLRSLRLGRELEKGFVLTVEPGIYFIPELIEKWEREGQHTDYINYSEIKKYINFGGMRYEGNYLVTEEGNRRLGQKMPKYFNEIEEVMKNN